MQFIILHGSFGHPHEAWFPKLKTDLESLRQHVLLPQMPVDDWNMLTQQGKIATTTQTLSNWLQTFETKVIPNIDMNQPIGIICHSISCVFTLHCIEHFDLKLDTAIFVAPFLSKLNKSWQIDKVNQTFYHENFDFKLLQSRLQTSYTLLSDNDPYVDINKSLEFAQKLNSSVIQVKGAGHMGNSSGITNFGLVREISKTRFNFSN